MSEDTVDLKSENERLKKELIELIALQKDTEEKWSRNYLSAVNGRREFREALKQERKNTKELERLAKAWESEYDRLKKKYEPNFGVIN